ncbi:hypothetical protein Tco_0714474 [Tanacetum coccineum]
MTCDKPPRAVSSRLGRRSPIGTQVTHACCFIPKPRTYSTPTCIESHANEPWQVVAAVTANETDARISSIYAASVARIQRSKSRHKALKRRTNKAGNHNDRILSLLMPPSDKLVDAVETSQRLSEGVTKGVLKPCCSSSYTESSWFPSPYARHQKVSKQLNFNEVEECDLDETCSPLSKKRKMDGFESASSVDHKSISPFFERQSLIANVLSSSPKAADTLSDNNFDERINDETTNLGLETDENLVGGDVENNSKISVYNNIIDATCDTSLKEVTTIVDEEKLQSGHVNVMEGVNVPNVSLGGDTRKASLTRKTQGQNNTICGRVMRSRSQRQQTSGMGKSSRPPKSASYNLTGSSAQQSGVTEEVNVLDFSLGSYYASKTSITERTQRCTKAKPTDIRSGSPKESALGVVNLENGEQMLKKAHRCTSRV